jgi:hypothetical protein
VAGLSQNLKAVITFGGNIDSSWSRSANGLQKSLKDVGKQSEKLTKDQAKLAAEIKRAKLAGQSLGDLKRRYSDVSREIRKTEADQQKLNQQMQKTQRLAAFKGAGKGLFRRGLGIAGQLGGMVAPGLAIGGGGMVASALGTLIAPATTNAETARRAGVAKSYSVDIPTFDAWDTLAKQYDMNGENIGDLFEEYLHKAGEYKQNGKQGSLQDAFDTLGFKAGDLAGLSDMAQFEKIVERALSLQDESKASFALDSLFGGEASKLLMLMKQSGKSYRDLMDEQRRYNLVTKEGAEGAMEGNRAITNLKTVFSSAMAEISGQLGNELAPDVRHLTDDLAEWFKGGGIKRIVSFLRNDLYPGVLTDDIRFPRNHFLFHVEENLGKRLPGEATAAETDKVITAENVQYRGAVIHSVTLDSDGFLLRFITAQHEEQVAAIQLVQLIPGRVFHRHHRLLHRSMRLRQPSPSCCRSLSSVWRCGSSAPPNLSKMTTWRRRENNGSITKY